MQAIIETGVAKVVAIADPSAERREEARALAPAAAVASDIRDMLQIGVDGIAIATPSALHAQQSIEALEGGAAVFCQKPLGRNQVETSAVLEAARTADRLLGVDLSYRFTTAMGLVRD